MDETKLVYRDPETGKINPEALRFLELEKVIDLRDDIDSDNDIEAEKNLIKYLMEMMDVSFEEACIIINLYDIYHSLSKSVIEFLNEKRRVDS